VTAPDDSPTPAAQNSTAEDLLRVILETWGDPGLCEALRKESLRTGQNKYRNLATTLGGKRPGAPEIDDTAVLRRIAPGREGIGKAAREMAMREGIKPTSVARRLRRKREKEKLNGQNNCVRPVQFNKKGP
jgi:hypothetical protein